MRYLGLDLGSKTLGIAISDPSGMIASSYQILRHNEEYERLADEVALLVKEKDIDKIVLGFPKNMDNSIGFKGELSIKFKEKLEEKTNKEVILQDERLTTRQVESMLILNDTSRKKRKKVIDSLAATVILQSYLDRKDR